MLHPNKYTGRRGAGTSYFTLSMTDSLISWPCGYMPTAKAAGITTSYIVHLSTAGVWKVSEDEELKKSPIIETPLMNWLPLVETNIFAVEAWKLESCAKKHKIYHNFVNYQDYFYLQVPAFDTQFPEKNTPWASLGHVLPLEWTRYRCNVSFIIAVKLVFAWWLSRIRLRSENFFPITATGKHGFSNTGQRHKRHCGVIFMTPFL